jgi:hypothetical protein
MNELTVHFHRVLRTEISKFSNLWIICFLLYTKMTKCCLWNDVYTAHFFTPALYIFLTYTWRSFLRVVEFRKTPCFALYKIHLWYFRYLAFKNILCLRVCFTAGTRKVGWREVRKRNVAKLNSSANSQTYHWWHFIQATACSKRLARLLFSKTLMKMWQLICHLLFILGSIIYKHSTFPGKQFTQTVSSAIKAPQFTHSRT